MDFDDIVGVIALFEQNVRKVKANLSEYHDEVNIVLESLMRNRLSDGRRATDAAVCLHHSLLRSVSEVNEYIIKLNLHIKLNRLNEHESTNLINNNYELSYTNRDGIVVGELDVTPTTITTTTTTSTNTMVNISDTKSASESEISPHNGKTCKEFAIPKIPLEPRNSPLLPPNGGRQTTAIETYERLIKNISNYTRDRTMQVTMMELNISENCIFVAKWDVQSLPLQNLMACQLAIQEIDQLPDFGEMFAVYDPPDQCIQRVLINGHTEGGGYDAYLPDFGEHIHLEGNELIFRLPTDVAALPAEAVKCYVRNREVGYMSKFMNNAINVRILTINRNYLVVELMDDLLPGDLASSASKLSEYTTTKSDNEAQNVHEEAKTVDGAAKTVKEAAKTVDEGDETVDKAAESVNDASKTVDEVVQTLNEETQTVVSEAADIKSYQLKFGDFESVEDDSDFVLDTAIDTKMKLNPKDMVMLENNESSTSNAVKAVLGFNPTDDRRICRNYDPDTGSCFKGFHCRLLHQPLAPHGATKDKQVAGSLPETIYTSMTHKVGTTARVQVTHISSPIHVYVQFVDKIPPLVWSPKDVDESERTLKGNPLPLDMVLALYNDGFYYRAQILDETDKVFKIFYVDYGNTEFVTIELLAQCNIARSLKPHRAVSCFIWDAKTHSLLSEQQGFECVQFLKSQILNNEYEVSLVSQMPDGYVIKFLDEDLVAQLLRRNYLQLN